MTLYNTRLHYVKAGIGALWAITKFRLGDSALLPLPIGNVDDAGLYPTANFPSGTTPASLTHT